MLQPGAASLSAAADELIGPYSGAVQPQPLPWVGDAGFEADPPLYQPLLLVRLLRDLEDEAVTVTVAADGFAPAGLTFAPWSERGSQLVGFVPATDAGGAAVAFRGKITARHTAGDLTADLAGVDVMALLGVDLVQGLLGRLTAVLMAEKAQLRRQAREIRAMRTLRHAHSGALDRHGADLGVPRLADRITWDAGTRQVATQALPGNREADPDYRPRLHVVRGHRLPSPQWIDANLNGPGDTGDPGAGWLAELGCPHRVTVDESANPLFVAFRLIAPGRGRGRAELLDAIRQTHLMWPAGSAAGDRAHAGRMVPAGAQPRINETRAALAELQLPPEQPVAPALALAMRRLEALQRRLGARPYPSIIEGQHDDGGSRYELGLGARLARPPAADVEEAFAAARGLRDPALQPVSPAEDPDATWLLRACGVRTAHQLTDGTMYVSTVSAGGLVVDVTPSADSAVPLALPARIETSDGATIDAPLAGVVTAMRTADLSPTDPAPLLEQMQPSETEAELDRALADLDLPRVVDVRDVRSRMERVPPRDYGGYDLGDRTSDFTDDPDRLAALVAGAARGGASSVLPFVTATGSLALLFGAVDLPLAGNNLAAAHTVAFRWQSRSLVGDAPLVSPRRGATVGLTTPGEGIGFVTCLAYVRTGANDPYQWRPSLPDGALLDLRQYEHLMNIVELVTPIGVRADTWAIRRRHVDVDGSGKPTPMNPSAARTYHRYRP